MSHQASSFTRRSDLAAERRLCRRVALVALTAPAKKEGAGGGILGSPHEKRDPRLRPPGGLARLPMPVVSAAIARATRPCGPVESLSVRASDDVPPASGLAPCKVPPTVLALSKKVK